MRSVPSPAPVVSVFGPCTSWTVQYSRALRTPCKTVDLSVVNVVDQSRGNAWISVGNLAQLHAAKSLFQGVHLFAWWALFQVQELEVSWGTNGARKKSQPHCCCSPFTQFLCSERASETERERVTQWAQHSQSSSSVKKGTDKTSKCYIKSRQCNSNLRLASCLITVHECKCIVSHQSSITKKLDSHVSVIILLAVSR